MNLQSEKTAESCPRADIAAYIDGELSPRSELALENHFAVCPACKAEFNDQKKLLHALDFAFIREREIELPENFTKTIVINAESSVRGLRCPKERSRALFLCGSLFLLIILGLGSETGTVLSTFSVFFDQVAAVGSFLGHLIYDVAVALTTILRLVGRNLIFNSTFALIGWSVFLAATACMFSRLMFRFNNSKT